MTKQHAAREDAMTVTDTRGTVHTLTLEHIGRELYARALQADVCYTMMVLEHTGKTRWNMNPQDELIPAILDAYKRKVKADTEWLIFNRW